MKAQELNGTHIGETVVWLRVENDGIPRYIGPVTMVLHKKNGNVRVRDYNSHDTELKSYAEVEIQ